MTQGQRSAVPRTRGRLIRAPRRHGQAGHDRQRLGVLQPPLAPRLRRPRAAPYPHQAVHAADRPRVQPEDPAERFIQTSLCESAYAHPSRPRTTVPPRSSLWLEHYNTARPRAALAHQPPATRLGQPAFLGSTASTVPPFRPAITDGGAAQDALRRLALGACGAPGADPTDRSRSHRREPNARPPEQCFLETTASTRYHKSALRRRARA